MNSPSILFAFTCTEKQSVNEGAIIKIGDYHHFNTDTGINVSFRPSPGCEMVAFYVFVNAGVRDEPAHLNGLSHLCEHLLFSGTHRLTQQELFHKITETGGYFNAFTRRDNTLFLAVFPANFIMDGMELLSSMIFKSELTQEAIDREKFVISQEIRENSMRDDFLPIQLFYNAVFQSSSYSLPVLGTQKTLNCISLNDAVNYYKRHYVPAKMRILLLGDIDEIRAERYTRFFFSEKYPEFRSSKIITERDIRPVSPPMTLNTKPYLITKKADVKKNYLFIAMKAPGTDSPLFLPFNLFSELLYTGGSLSLENRLRSILKEHFRELHITYLFWKDKGLLVFRILTDTGFPPGDAMDMFFSELNNILSNPIPEKDLKEYLITEEANRLYGAEKINIYGLLESQSFINLKREMFSNFLESLKTITPAHIQKTAKEVISSAEWECMGVEAGKQK